jgi:hypothetical protein
MNEGFSDIWGACIEFQLHQQNQHGLLVKILKEELVIYRFVQ